MKQGWITEPAHEYHASPGASSTVLKTIALQSPAHAKAMMDTPKEQTPAMRLGTAVHAMVLEGVHPLVMPDFGRSNDEKARKAEWLEQNKNFVVCTQEEFDAAAQITEAIIGHLVAGKLLAPGSGRAEVSGYSQSADSGIDRKIRPDFARAGDGIILDLKTTGDASLEGFSRTIANFGYHIQAAYYLDTANLIEGTDTFKTFVWIAVETKPPYAVAVYVADDAMIKRGREHYERAYKLYAECISSGIWPSYSNEATYISLPKWAE